MDYKIFFRSGDILRIIEEMESLMSPSTKAIYALRVSTEYNYACFEYIYVLQAKEMI